MLGILNRRFVPRASSLSKRDLRTMRREFMKKAETAGVLLVDTIQDIETEHEQIILAERQRLSGIVKDTMGDYGPNDWGRGYYDAMEDMLDLLAKGI